MEFALWGGLSKEEGETTARACLMSFSDPKTLRSFPHLFEQEAAMIEDFKQIQQNPNQSSSQAYCKGGQIMVLVFALAASADNDIQLMNDSQFTNIDPALISQFRLFMLSRHTLQTEISLMEEKPVPRALTAEVAEGRGLDAIVKEFGLSPREKEVLELVVKASSNKEIAAALFISEHTVKNHLTNIFNKMSVTDRAQAIAAVFNKSIG
ncbi:LuxR family transcriptional regulator [Paenibacillus sp. CFBP13512]|nr:LuxR family transcriptional regulator [Paenibacillus sp. CFBP13512]